MTHQLWPYDEVKLTFTENPGELSISSPWLKVNVLIETHDVDRARLLVEAFPPGNLDRDTIKAINWLFRPLQHLPLCYFLPRSMPLGEASDRFQLSGPALQEAAPKQLLQQIIGQIQSEKTYDSLPAGALPETWQWDIDTAIAFSTTKEGIDPLALFTVGRRFHLLGFVEKDLTRELYSFVRSLKADKYKFEFAVSIMVRQNHYVTAACDAALRPALHTALAAKSEVEEFIAAEAGHDRIMLAALKSLGQEPDNIPVLAPTKVLMQLLKFAAQRNFLAFAMMVDFFERSSYQDSDPLAEVLAYGELMAAARHINRHKNINDAGEHENQALDFLKTMGLIDPDYAREAMRLAELATDIMTSLSTAVLAFLKQNAGDPSDMVAQ